MYAAKPARLLKRLGGHLSSDPNSHSYCAGFELQKWRCDALAKHLIEWMADYALWGDELKVDHGNMYEKLRKAAARIYTSDAYAQRGEVGELLLHGICRDFFDTIPLAPRVFYLTSSNDVVKSFDLVHMRDLGSDGLEIWLGEAKFYEDAQQAIQAAIESIRNHIDAGFLNREKLILTPQIASETPRVEEIRSLLSEQSSLDELFEAAVFPICIAARSGAAGTAKAIDSFYAAAVLQEADALRKSVIASGLAQKIRIVLLYVPLASKEALAQAFDKKLKGLCV